MTPRASVRIGARPVTAHSLTVAVLRTKLGRLFTGLCELSFFGRISGRLIRLPVQCVRDQDRLLIYVGGSTGKKWWRNFTNGHSVQVHFGGLSYRGYGHVVGSEHSERRWAERTYRRRYPKVGVLPANPMVIIDLTPVAD